jgi:NAD(P)-dependent dehydrogenase (short-subunit alcohol dehydrogenase family)
MLLPQEAQQRQFKAIQVTTLTGQSALVTGAGRGIGKAIALRLAAEGAKVTLAARSLDQIESVAAQIRAAGGEAAAIATDVTDHTAVANAVAAANRFGRVSILVNNAGIAGPYGPIGVVDPLEWWASQQVHALGPLLFMSAVIPGMRARAGGRIINIVSRAALEPVPHLSAYAVGKCTAVRLTEHVDLEHKQHSVRAFALHPGTIITDMARGTLSSLEAQRWMADGIEFLKARRPEDSDADLARCTDVVVALAAGRYDALGGRYLSIDWDLDAKLRESA